jgi:hypothetical protein
LDRLSDPNDPTDPLGVVLPTTTNPEPHGLHVLTPRSFWDRSADALYALAQKHPTLYWGGLGGSILLSVAAGALMVTTATGPSKAPQQPATARPSTSQPGTRTTTLPGPTDGPAPRRPIRRPTTAPRPDIRPSQPRSTPSPSRTVPRTPPTRTQTPPTTPTVRPPTTKPPTSQPPTSQPPTSQPPTSQAPSTSNSPAPETS